jgi:hypothetical protein
MFCDMCFFVVFCCKALPAAAKSQRHNLTECETIVFKSRYNVLHRKSLRGVTNHTPVSVKRKKVMHSLKENHEDFILCAALPAVPAERENP